MESQVAAGTEQVIEQQVPDTAVVDTAVSTTQEATTEVTEAAPVIEKVEAVTPPAPIDPMEALGLKDIPGADKFLEALKAGDLPNYLKIATTDYRKMPDEDVFRVEIENENKGASDKIINYLLKQRMSKYDLGFDADDDDKEAVEEMRKSDADKVRDALEAAKAQYEIPKPTAQTTAIDPEVEKVQKQQAEDARVFQAQLDADPVLKEFEMNPVLKIGKGDDAFNYAVDKSVNIRAALSDTNAFYSQFFTQAEGKPPVFNSAKWTRVMAYAANPDKYDAELAKHFKTLGEKAEYDSRHNPDTEMAGTPVASGSKITVRRV